MNTPKPLMRDARSPLVCEECFADEDLREWIRDQDWPPGCSFCHQSDAPTAPIDELGDYMRECLKEFYEFAVDNLPWESAEGGYQAPHWDTFDLLFDVLELDLPRDSDLLRRELPDYVTQEVWCEYDWTSLPFDSVLVTSWSEFCALVKHKRRFFFHRVGEAREDRDRLIPERLLDEIASLAEDTGLIRNVPAGTKLFRARPDDGRGPYLTSLDLGPPPATEARQSNRMNPPGIPMMYAAESVGTAVEEIRAKAAFVGEFQLTREIRVLDLADLPAIPGIFSGASRRRRLGLTFLHEFQADIMKPVKRDERVHIEYIPTQIVTEYFRSRLFEWGSLDGIRYASAVSSSGRNLVLFASQNEIGNASSTLSPSVWIHFICAHRRSRSKIRDFLSQAANLLTSVKALARRFRRT